MASLNDFLKIAPIELIMSNDTNYKFLEGTPSPQKCKYCGKTLYHEGVKWKNSSIIQWSSYPMDCDCSEFQAEKKRKSAEAYEKHMKLACINEIRRNSGLCKREIDRTFSNFITNDSNREAKKIAYQYSSNFTKKILEENTLQSPNVKSSLFIEGKVGRGKSHLASAICNQLIEDQVKVVFTTITSLLQRVRETFSSSSNSEYSFESEVIEKYVSCDLLVIDDFGKEKASEWSVSKIFEIINRRYENYKPIVITSNYALDSIENRLIPANSSDNTTARAIVDRLYEICYVIRLTGDSFRKNPIKNSSLTNSKGDNYGF